jgi:hypothetical protein
MDGILFPYLTVGKTCRFGVVEASSEHQELLAAAADHKVLVHLDLNCDYTRGVVRRALDRRALWVTRVSHDELDAVNMNDAEKAASPPILQIADFENLRWEMVLRGGHRASSYMVRKGLSRKAQLALQIKRYTAKHPTSVLKAAFPETMIVETWGAFEEVKVDFGMGMVADFGTGSIQAPLRDRLSWCIEDYRATIVGRAAGSYDVRYDDGDKEEGLQPGCLRAPGGDALDMGRVALNTPVEANYRGGGCWHPGKISRLPSADGTDRDGQQAARWILKPSVTNKGADISLCDGWESLLDALEATPHVREWVLQRYIERPLTVRGYKFHLRVYVLCVGALQVYVFDQVLMLLAAHKYGTGTSDDIYSHLTNTARAVEDVNFSEKKFVKVLDDLPHYMHRECPHLMQGMSGPALTQHLRKKVHEQTGALFKAFENEYTVFSPLPGCFELYGLDYMLDQDLNMSFLEANPGPDFKQTGGRLKGLIGQLWEQTLAITVDGCPGGAQNCAPDFTLVYDEEASVSHLQSGMSLG